MTPNRIIPRHSFAIVSTLALALLAPLSPAGAQGNGAAPAQAGAPAQPAANLKTISFTLVFERPGTYQCYPIVNGMKGGGISVPPGQSTLPVEVSTNTAGIEVLDEVTGLVADVPLGRIKPGRRLRVRPDAFNQIQALIVKLNSKNGEPAAKGVIRVSYAGGEPIQYGLRTMDDGQARFEDVPLGTAEISAYANTGDDVIKQTVTIAPTKGGNPMVVTMTLPVDVITVKPSPVAGGKLGTDESGQTIIINNGGDQHPAPKNDWVSGVVGLALLIAAGLFGMRWMKQKGLTFKDLLAQIGVDSPGAAVPAGPNIGLRSSDGSGSALPPLPSLSDLPVGGAARGPVNIVSEPGFAGPRLIGLSGPAAGTTYALRSDTESMLAVGRDPQCTMPFPGDSALSRRHAVFLVNGAGWDVMDEGSMNGTFVNSKRIDGRAALSPGDEIQIGMSRFRFEAE